MSHIVFALTHFLITRNIARHKRYVRERHAKWIQEYLGVSEWGQEVLLTNLGVLPVDQRSCHVNAEFLRSQHHGSIHVSVCVCMCMCARCMYVYIHRHTGRKLHRCPEVGTMMCFEHSSYRVLGKADDKWLVFFMRKASLKRLVG